MSADSQFEFEVARRALGHPASGHGVLEDTSDRHQGFITHSYPHQLPVHSDHDDLSRSAVDDVLGLGRESTAFGFWRDKAFDSSKTSVLDVDGLLRRLSAESGAGLRLMVSSAHGPSGTTFDAAEAWAAIGPEIGGQSLEESHRRLLIDQVDAVAREAGDYGWDGADGVAVAAAVVSNAKRLIVVFPLLGVLPELAATEHGEIRFDWAPSTTCTLTLTVGAASQIAFGGLFGDTLVSGNEPWESDLPQLVQCCFEQLRSYEAGAISGVGSAHRDVSERRLRSRVFKAIEDADEAWQDVASLARRSALPEELVLRVLYDDSSDVISEQLAGGKVVFTTRRHFLGKASAAQRLLGAFRNRLR